MADAEKYSVAVGINRNLGAKLRVAPEEGESDVAVVEHTLPPNTLAAPLHRHSCEDELSYILEGTMGVQEEESVSTVETGEFAVKARDVWHTFWNAGSGQLRFLEIIAPGEFAWYFERADEILPEQGEPDETEARELAELHDAFEFEMKPESVPELLERHGLDV
ncbi:cupin domain-containing protein [Halovenus marina]|uniref:cupin domain-containing protein n=1 Tax=Halovenus marina TaxID=3396621 RepID=UPI003F564CA0